MKDIKFLSHKVKVIFPHGFADHEDDIQGISDSDASEIRIAAYHSNGVKRVWTKILQTYFHEISHLVDGVIGHDIFQDEDEEIEKAKEKSLDAFWEVWLQVMIDNKMLSKDFLDMIRREVSAL
jgi:hypothetical protein